MWYRKILSLCLLSCLPFPVLGATYLVRPDGTGDFPTIQAAVDAAQDGDVILLASGVFQGPGNRDVDFRGKAVEVRSESGNPEDCVIDCEGNVVEPHRAFLFVSGEGPGSVLSGITIVSGYWPWEQNAGGGAIWCVDSSPTISNCVFEANYAEHGGAMLLWSSAATITDCLFRQNVALRNGAGIYITTGSDVLVERVTFVANEAWLNGAALAVNAASATLRNGTLYGNQCDGANGIWVINGGTVTIENSILSFAASGFPVICDGGTVSVSCTDVYGNAMGDWVDCLAPFFGQNGNIHADPLFCDPEAGNFRLRTDSPCAPGTPPNPECDLIGAWPVGCGPTAVVPMTWGRIKVQYRP
jgi:hypothetical protein